LYKKIAVENRSKYCACIPFSQTLGMFLTAMTVNSRVFFCVRERPKNAFLASTWSDIPQILCCVNMSAKNLLKRLIFPLKIVKFACKNNLKNAVGYIPSDIKLLLQEILCFEIS